MNGFIAAAGKSSRMRRELEKYGVKSKCLLRVGKRTILESIVISMKEVGVGRLVIMVNEDNQPEIEKFLKEREIDAKILVQDTSAGVTGTAVAFRQAMDYFSESVLLCWSDSLSGIPRFDERKNWIFCNAVSQAESFRYDCVCISGSKALAISSRKVRKEGPSFGNTGIYHLANLDRYEEAYAKVLYKEKSREEVPIELVFQEMINDGVEFYVDVLDFHVDLGSPEFFEKRLFLLGGGL